MAEAPSSLDNYLSCQICFESFEENGDHIPRILPCHHTVCESCIKGMIQWNKIICPECREEHQAKKQEKSFQQNKYILVQMSRRKKNEKDEGPKVDMCPQHKKEIIFFCEEEGCKKPICKTCLTKEHKKHDVVEIEDKKKEALLKNIENARKDLSEKISILFQAKDEVREKTKVTVNQLQKAKEEMNKKFDIMIKEAENKIKDATARIDGDVAMINENIVLLEQMGNNVAAEREIALESLNDGQETVAEVINTVKVNICGSKKFNIKTFQATQEISYGSFDEDVITIVIPELRDFEKKTAPDKAIPIFTDASELKWKVTNTVVSRLTKVSNIATLTDGSLVISGKDGQGWKLKQFNMKDNTTIYTEELTNEPNGLAEISLGGRPALAILYQGACEIEFRSLDDLSQIIHSYSTGSIWPGALCALSASILLYIGYPIADGIFAEDKIHWLDCSETEPKLTGKKINVKISGVVDICYVPNETKPLLLVAQYGKIRAYNVLANKLEWESEVSVNSLTTDCHNYVIMCCFLDKCAYMLSLSDGKKLGCLMRDGDQGLGGLKHVRWCNVTSSLIVVHEVQKEIQISTIQFE